MSDFQAPAEVGQPSTSILPKRTRFAGPLGKSFRYGFARPPRSRTKAQAAKRPIALSSPYPQKLGYFDFLLIFLTPY